MDSECQSYIERKLRVCSGLNTIPATREENWADPATRGGNSGLTLASLVISFPLSSCPEGVHEPQKMFYAVSKLALCGRASVTLVITCLFVTRSQQFRNAAPLKLFGVDDFAFPKIKE